MWSRILKRTPVVLLRYILAGIPTSLLVSVVLWFFAVVIASQEVAFFTIWKWTYLVLVGTRVAKYLLGTCFFALQIRESSKKWGIPQVVIYAALVDYGIHDDLEGGVYEFWALEPEEARRYIRKQVIIKSIARPLTEALTKHLK